MTQPTKPTLTASDPPDWYECRYVFESRDDRVARYWDGERLRLNPQNSGWYGVTDYTDFRRLVYEPTPQPGVAELVAACQTLVAIDDQPPENRMVVLLIAIEKARDALAAVEAAEQERGK